MWRELEGGVVAAVRQRQLGVLVRDRLRSLVAVSAGGELAVALRELLPREFVVVRDARPDEVGAVYAACLPFPWLLCGDTPAVDPAVTVKLRRDPVAIGWLGELPSGLPGHARGFATFRDLAGYVQNALHAGVSGMRLAPGLGVSMPDGGSARSAPLEALIAAHPEGIDVPLPSFRSAARALAEHRLGVRPQRSEGRVRLVATQ
ncbi:MAG: hypothetical protein JOZ92_00960 [Candidatus Dormibacteraeota bacterium]|nr:hypothetical protein [Candidatus Dormibacteraeota bacterium]